MRIFPIVAIFILGLCSCERPQPKAASGAESAAYVKSINDWSQGLTKDGESMGKLMLDIIEGTTKDTASIDSALLEFEENVALKIKELNSSEPPKTHGASKYRDLFVEYLHWQKSNATDMMRKTIPLALDSSQSNEQRMQKIATLLISANEDEIAWKKRLKEMTDEVYASINSGRE